MDVYIVTGASRGIGAAIARQIVAELPNSAVVINFVSDSSASKADQLVAEINSTPSSIERIKEYEVR